MNIVRLLNELYSLLLNEYNSLLLLNEYNSLLSLIILI
jgi:hypothetical protein